jgi:hypothetical protein
MMMGKNIVDEASGTQPDGGGNADWSDDASDWLHGGYINHLKILYSEGRLP